MITISVSPTRTETIILPTDAECLDILVLENQSVSTVCLESFIRVRNDKPIFHFELAIDGGNSQSHCGSESDVSWKCQLFSNSALVSEFLELILQTYCLSPFFFWIKEKLGKSYLILSLIFPVNAGQFSHRRIFSRKQKCDLLFRRLTDDVRAHVGF